MLTKLTPEVDFTNHLHANLTCADPKSSKRQSSHQWFLHSWDLRAKNAAHKTVKLCSAPELASPGKQKHATRCRAAVLPLSSSELLHYFFRHYQHILPPSFLPPPSFAFHGRIYSNHILHEDQWDMEQINKFLWFSVMFKLLMFLCVTFFFCHLVLRWSRYSNSYLRTMTQIVSPPRSAQPKRKM